jgi:hypothetical protein
MEIDFGSLSNGELKQLLADAKKEMDFRESEAKRIHLQSIYEVLMDAVSKYEINFIYESREQDLIVSHIEKTLEGIEIYLED